jgi:type I restriction enzyme S subunit
VNDYFGGTIPWVKSGELGDGHVFDTEETLSELGLKSSNAKVFPQGTLCIALYGATVGKLGILEVDAATNQAVCGIFLNNRIARDYVFHYLASIRRHLIEQGQGGAQSNISNGLVRQTSIPLAPTKEQHRIIAKIEELFSDLDAGVAALERAKANLKRYRAAVLKAAVEGKLTEQWRAEHSPKETASQLLERILEERRRKWEAEQLAAYEKAGKTPPANWKRRYKEPTGPDGTNPPALPEGWCWARFDQCAEEATVGHVGPMKDEYVKEGIPFLRSQNVRPLHFDPAGLKFIGPSFHAALSKSVLHGGELLVVRSGTIGDACVYPSDQPESNCADLVITRLLPGVVPEYAAIFVVSPPGRIAVGARQTGIALTHFNVGAMKLSGFPLPPEVEQQQIVAEVERRLSLAQESESQLDANRVRSSRLRQSILKRAFEGKLVPQDPKDEPASVLLERIKAENARTNGKAKTRKTR